MVPSTMKHRQRRTVAIIGGGPSGLLSAKEALAQGLSPHIFEKNGDLGGLWAPSGGTWDSMHTNISKYTCSFSDFPWNDDIQDFPTKAEVWDYLCQYASTFHLMDHLYVNRSVKSITTLGGVWEVTWTDYSSVLHTQTYDFVIIACGIFSEAWLPSIPGLESFEGRVVHSKSYQNADDFLGQRIAVVGNSFSGCEIAGDVAMVAESVVHVSSKPVWIIPRYLSVERNQNTVDLPGDLVFYSRAARRRSMLQTQEEQNIGKNAWLRSVCSLQSAHPEIDPSFSADPSHPPFVTISDSYVHNVASKKISVKTGANMINRLDKGSIHFSDATRIEIDAVIFCTGYSLSLPFFGQEILEKLEFEKSDKLQPVLLHKTVFPRDLYGICFVGLYRGPFFGVMELQARWACAALSGSINWPDSSDIANGIIEERKIRETQPPPQFPHGDYVAFSESLAAEIGVLPDLDIIRQSDPELHDKLLNGPFTSASYRLFGEGSDSLLANRVINKINERASL